jgi:hypothetical protein
MEQGLAGRHTQCVAKVAALQADRNQGGRLPGVPGEAWQVYFGRKVTELGTNAVCDSYGTSGNGITAHAADEDDLARVIEAIDLAIEYANDRYESDVLPNVLAPRRRQEQKTAEAAQSQAGLDELAAKFAKPDRDT